MDKKELGILGEALAQELLIRKGFQIVELNWRWKKLEVDIIAWDQEELVVVEVKTRESNYLGEPWEFITKKQQRNLIQAADQFIKERDIDAWVRFDVVSVVVNSKGEKVEHLVGAFWPGQVN